MNVPDDLVIPDAKEGYTPNESCAFLMPNGNTIMQIAPACRVEKGSEQIVGYLWDKETLRGNGITGSHGGSGLSAIGRPMQPLAPDFE